MTHRCNRCRVEYESGGFFNGQDYCMNCCLTLKSQDDKKRREIEEAKQKAIDDRRKLSKQTLINEAQAKYKEQREELKRRRTAEEMKRREMLEARRQADEQKLRKRRELMHQRSYGRQQTQHDEMGFYGGAGISAYDNKGILPLDQQSRTKHRPIAKKAKEKRTTGDWSAHSSGDFRIEEHGRDEHHAYPFSLSIGGEMPKEVVPGIGARIVLIGKNSSSKRAEVGLFVSPLSDSARANTEIKPKKCFIEAGAEAKFELEIIPEKGATGIVLLEAYLKENAFYIDPEQGKSAVERIEMKVKKK